MRGSKQSKKAINKRVHFASKCRQDELLHDFVGLRLCRPLSFFLLLCLVLFSAEQAFAQPGQDSVKPGAKGIIGGTLLGAEIVVSLESLAGVYKPWHYGLGAGLGAVGGGVGGYFIGKANTPAATSLLVGGIFLAIPATVFALNGLSQHPATQEADLSQAGVDTVRLQVIAPLAPPPGLVALDQGQWCLTVPTIQVSELSTRDEQLRYRARKGALVDVSLLRMRF
jgi:hypothetical protein